MARITKKYIKLIIVVLITIFIFWMLFKKVDFTLVWETIININIWWLAAGFLIVIFFPIIATYRWQIILKTLGINLRFWQSFKIVMGTYSVASITPSKLGHIARAYPIKNLIPVSQSVGIVLLERVIDISILITLSFIGGIIYKNTLITIIMLIGLLFVIAFFILGNKINKIKLPIKKTWQDKISQVFYCLQILIKHPKQLIIVVFMTLLNWIGVFIQVYFLYLALGFNIPFLFICFNLPIALFVGILPITLSGMGTRDSAIVYLFSKVAPANINLSTAILYSLSAYWFLVILGIPFIHCLTKTYKENIDL